MTRWHGPVRIYWTTILLVGFCATQESCEKNPTMHTVPDRIRTLVVYDVEGINGGDIPEGELAQMPKASVAPEAVKEMFEHVTWKPGSPIWKTGCLGKATLDDGSECTIAISHYGGIFVVLGQPGYYVVNGESRTTWDHVMNEILVNTFIPARKEGRGRAAPGG